MSLVVYCPYFGELPPWWRLTLRSMALNPLVDFVLIGDRVPLSDNLTATKNVQSVNMSFPEYQNIIQRLAPVRLRWRSPCIGYECGTASKARGASRSNKISDSRPFLGAAFQSISDRYAWWGWMDIDVIFGRINIMRSTREVFCPLWPNAVGLITWGVFTAFKREAVLHAKHGIKVNASVSTGLQPYLLAWQWPEALASSKRQAFEELSITCGGPKCGMGMSNALNPKHCQTAKVQVAEVNRCKNRFGPCALGKTVYATLSRQGASQRASLVTNGRHNVLLLHLFESKARWGRVPDVSTWACINMTNLDQGIIRVRRCD
jgi:hypothetical protein